LFIIALTRLDVEWNQWVMVGEGMLWDGCVLLQQDGFVVEL